MITFPEGQGIAPDPYSGINRYFDVNLSVPNEVSVGYPVTTSAQSGGTLGKPIADSTRWFGYGTPGVPSGSPQSFAMLDDGGQVFEATSIAGTWTKLATSASVSGATNNDGIAYWLGYLFKTRGANIDYWDGSTWVNAWKTTLTGGTKHFMFVASNNVLYITNGNYIASVTANTPSAFDPTNGGTFVFNNQKLQIPVEDVAISLAEVGYGSSSASLVLIGGIQNQIYPWDKTSAFFNTPIYVADAYIKNMVSTNQNVYIFPGNQQGRGRIFITNGSQAEVFFKVPDYVFSLQDPYYVWGDAIVHRNNLFWGMYVVPNAGSSPLNFAEVWALDLATKSFRSVSPLVSSQGTGANATSLISTANLSSPGFGFIAGSQDGSSSGTVEYSGTTSGLNSQGAQIITDLMPVGTFLKKKTFSQVEIKLRTPLASGESITVAALVDGGVSGSGTNMTFAPTLTSGALSAVAPVNFMANQWLQFQLLMIGNSATSGCRLYEIRVR